MNRHAIIVSIVLAAFLSAGSMMAPAQAQTRAVIELFTSQGCNSCPPADRLAGELARDPSLVVMSLPVDYWDYLGWKDTLAKPRHSARQRNYAHERGDRQVYTPQVVVNGMVHALGSDKSDIEEAIDLTRRDAATLAVPVKMSVGDGKLTVRVATEDQGAAQGEVWLCTLTKSVPIAIGRGENSGHTITYHNVVRRWIKLGDWSGTSHTFSMPTAELGTEADAAAVIVQAGTTESPGKMLGAAMTSIR